MRYKKGSLYILNWPGTSIYKIGVSIWPTIRAATIARHSGHSVTIIESFSFDDVYPVERFWHRTFRAQRTPLNICDGGTECFTLNWIQLEILVTTNRRYVTIRDKRMARSVTDDSGPLSMNKTAAAKRLNISVRSLQRAVQAGKLTVTYKRGKHGKQEAVFNADDVSRYKGELKSETVKPALTPPEQPTQALERIADRIESIATTRDTGMARSVIEGLAAMHLHVASELNASISRAEAAQATSLASGKLLLSLHDARALTGLSAQFLRAAIKDGKLKSRIIGKGYKIKRADLDAYIKKL
jgi:excisionase family DNA binding protein